MNCPTRTMIKLLPAIILGVTVCAPSARADKTWSEGDEINTPEISNLVYKIYGMGTTVSLSCNKAVDSDAWCDPNANPDSGSEDDTAVLETWSGGGDGTWTDSNGTSATFVTGTSVGTKTLTVTFDDANTVQFYDDSDSNSVNIEVVNMKMIFEVGENQTDTIERGQSGTFKVVDGNDQELEDVDYFNWCFDGAYDVLAGATYEESSWAGKIVQSGTRSVEITSGVDSIKVSKTITVTNRSGWTMSVHFNSDNDPNWGEPNFPGASVELGQCRGDETNKGFIIGPRTLEKKLDDAYGRQEVADGPNKGLWYVSSSSVAVNMESVINMWLKPGKEGYPPAAGSGFYEYNDEPDVDANALLTGIINHEGYGSGNGKAHYALIKAEIDSWDPNPAQQIEDNVADSNSTLEALCHIELSDFNDKAKDAGVEENIPYGSNFGPATVYWYDSISEAWDRIEYADGYKDPNK